MKFFSVYSLTRDIDKALLVSISGYMAPEYAMEGLFSVKSDVFSFGVLVLEIICGRKNGRFYLSDGQNLLVYVSLHSSVLEKLFNNAKISKTCTKTTNTCVGFENMV